jgi:hypothetical protein
MTIDQLSLFVENKPGELVEPCRLLADAGIHICALALEEMAQLTMLRLITADWRKAKAILDNAGYVVNVSAVVAVEVAAGPGAIADLFQLLGNAGINIEHAYSYPEGQGRTILIMQFDQPQAAVVSLKQAGIAMLDPVSSGLLSLAALKKAPQPEQSRESRDAANRQR